MKVNNNPIKTLFNVFSRQKIIATDVEKVIPVSETPKISTAHNRSFDEYCGNSAKKTQKPANDKIPENQGNTSNGHCIYDKSGKIQENLKHELDKTV